MAVPAQNGDGDSRTNVQMFESQGIGRRLRKAMDSLSRNEFESAIKVLQDVVEGRVTGLELEQENPKPDPKPDPTKVKAPDPFDEDNPAKAVFANDDRLYRPVRRLCQEYLAQMPTAGLELYRARYEVEANQAYERALARRDQHGLEDVAQRWFVTFAAAKALIASGDLLMDEGRFRAAMLAYQSLLEVWPAADLPKVANAIGLKTKIAACLQQLGETARVGEVLGQITSGEPDASVRLQGELVPVKALAQHALFRTVDSGATGPARQQELQLGPPERLDKLELAALWEHRFADPEPYRAASADRNQPDWVMIGDEGAALPSPRSDSFKPGTSVSFDRDGIFVLDHFQMRLHEALSGRIHGRSAGTREPPRPKAGQPRIRVPVYDFANLRPCIDRDRCYYVAGPERGGTQGGKRPELNTELVALDRKSLQRLWGSKDIPDQNVKDLAFLAVPTPFGERLLAPVLDRGAYALQCLEAATGKPVWRVHVNSGGSEFARALAVPVVVDGGTAYLHCNAGTIAAVDAFTGELRWARKHEIEHPFRTPQVRIRPRTNSPVGMASYYRETDVVGFGPSDLIVRDGRVLAAPVGGNVILCLDGATGDVLWMQSRTPAMRYVLGANRDHVYIAGTSVTCIDWRTGILLWETEPPASRISARFAGRGLVTQDWIVMPDERCLQVFPANRGDGSWTAIPLPTGLLQDDALRGPFNVFGTGPYLACAYEGGVEVFGVTGLLEDQATALGDPVERAKTLAVLGDLTAAILLVEAQMPATTGDERLRVGKLALTWMRDQAHKLAAAREIEDALRILDRAKPWLDQRELQLRWMLARIDVFQTGNDMKRLGLEREAFDRAVEGGK